MPGDYSLSDVLEDLHQSTDLGGGLELKLHVEQQVRQAGENVCGALEAIGENAGHIKQGLAKLKR